MSTEQRDGDGSSRIYKISSCTYTGEPFVCKQQKPGADVLLQSTLAPGDVRQPGAKVRVWWEPTDDATRGDFSGLYWAATVLERPSGNFLLVEHISGERKKAALETVSPAKPPVDFGSESVRLRAGEFCEVAGGSEEGAPTWLGRVDKVNKLSYQVSYPFNNVNSETVQEGHIRRARIWRHSDSSWKFLLPYQRWQYREVTAPSAMRHGTQDDLWKALSMGPQPEEGAGEAPGEPACAVEQLASTPGRRPGVGTAAMRANEVPSLPSIAC
mmetsp:Transcript_25684/g.61157  ORF Transcript_25684/g.61157 Transcript_25684/m.61157 type:complete len:270 (-) Transcript_25684:100-909(-)